MKRKELLLRLSPEARESLKVYYEGLLEAVATARAAGHAAPLEHDLRPLFTEPEDFPHLDSDPLASWLLGWLTGAAEACGGLPEDLLPAKLPAEQSAAPASSGATPGMPMPKPRRKRA